MTINTNILTANELASMTTINMNNVSISADKTPLQFSDNSETAAYLSISKDALEAFTQSSMAMDVESESDSLKSAPKETISIEAKELTSEELKLFNFKSSEEIEALINSIEDPVKREAFKNGTICWDTEKRGIENDLIIPTTHEDGGKAWRIFDTALLLGRAGCGGVPSEILLSLSTAIRAFDSIPDASLEERTMQRETALRMAQYIADNYLNDQKATDFMTEVNRQLEVEQQQERGYVVSYHYDNSEGRVYDYRMPHINSCFSVIMHDYDNRVGVDFMYWLENFLPDEVEKLRNSPMIGGTNEWDFAFVGPGINSMLWERYSPLFLSMHENGKMAVWVSEQTEAFEANKANVNKEMDDIRLNYDTLLESEKYASIVEWNNNMFALLDRLYSA